MWNVPLGHSCKFMMQQFSCKFEALLNSFWHCTVYVVLLEVNFTNTWFSEDFCAQKITGWKFYVGAPHRWVCEFSQHQTWGAFPFLSRQIGSWPKSGAPGNSEGPKALHPDSSFSKNKVLNLRMRSSQPLGSGSLTQLRFGWAASALCLVCPHPWWSALPSLHESWAWRTELTETKNENGVFMAPGWVPKQTEAAQLLLSGNNLACLYECGCCDRHATNLCGNRFFLDSLV